MINETNMVNIPTTLSTEAMLPQYMHGAGDACCDLYAAYETVILPHSTVLVPTDIRVAVPEGYAMLICSRSGLALKTNLFVLNAPGIIDPVM